MRPRLVYVSYDGMGEPLGQGQVLGYLEPLALDFRITLISFEKQEPTRELKDRIRSAGVDWVPLSYHRRPPVISTLWDIVRGAVTLRRVQRQRPADLVHVRSYVAGCVALIARARPLIFDIRGLWADERVEGGLWRRGGMVDRTVRMVERALFRSAAAVVTLTSASVPELRSMLSRLGREGTPLRVIPTCTEVGRFAETSEHQDGPRAVWVGSIGPWYPFELAVRFADAADMPMHVLTRQTEMARAEARPADTVMEVRPDGVPAELCEGDIGLCLYNDGRSVVARAPTRAAEYLAAGMPIAVTPGLGDLPELVRKHPVGAVVDFGDPASVQSSARELRGLASDPATRELCRKIARDRFSRDLGVNAYRRLYAELLSRE